MTMWYLFWPCGMLFAHLVCLFDHVVWFFKTTENINLGYLKVRNDKNLDIKRTPNLCCLQSHTSLNRRPAAPHTIFNHVWHFWAPNSCSMALHTTQLFVFLLVSYIALCMVENTEVRRVTSISGPTMLCASHLYMLLNIAALKHQRHQTCFQNKVSIT